MEWSKLYASLPDDPRVQAAEARQEGSGWLLIQCFCYCTRVESGGFIPVTQLSRFGIRKVKQKVDSLRLDQLLTVVTGGYMLDPLLWSEENNLNDQVERKRKADRERIAAKRAAERNGKVSSGFAQTQAQMSRDSSATCSATQSATSSRDSSALEKKEKRQPPPTPPAPRPLWPVAVPDAQTGEGEGDSSLDKPRLVNIISTCSPII